MKSPSNLPPLHLETLTVSAGYEPASASGSAKPPAYHSSTFVYPSALAAKRLHEAFFDHADNGATGYIYGRLGHPGLDIVEKRLAVLDGAEDAAIFATGMAAISAIMLANLGPGDVVLHSQPIYGGTDMLLNTELIRLGISAVGFPDGCDPDVMRKAADEALGKGRIALVWAETPANPTAAIVDLEEVARLIDYIEKQQEHRPLLGVDNTFLGPFVQSSLTFGADLCMTSLTKYAGGHSDFLAGGVSGSAGPIARLKTFRTLVGSTLDAHSAWLLARSFETMHLRTERAGDNARAIAEMLAAHPAVASVTYVRFKPEGSPARLAFERQCKGAGSTFSFRVRGDEAAAFRFLDALKILKVAVSLGGTETLICHPATTTHYAVARDRREALGIDDATLRISVGIEHIDDLLADIAHALEAV
ncbi:aminotransferase class I/II-fold pyridoxal phosphate-dependent enzyme [Rhizobium oryzicola]|uniref:Aminotransferase class I/II-fold pyridoxal phosphate-dependent enzyme n=1 Tax=Rhizobium oryzicola TaxID=1232668 RepID=A0ABT8SXS5_9HYPH|nr:aminotransferase class I/II-fold pyridoxal phosphate-dependent enzyme [Rhizobium oryzicola]MDO1583227.1 aminotransferase class I/II-fold pyridoxal phosphate-dependent enzyme [Rhizobium oryzicola]